MSTAECLATIGTAMNCVNQVYAALENFTAEGVELSPKGGRVVAASERRHFIAAVDKLARASNFLEDARDQLLLAKAKEKN